MSIENGKVYWVYVVGGRSFNVVADSVDEAGRKAEAICGDSNFYIMED